MKYINLTLILALIAFICFSSASAGNSLRVMNGRSLVARDNTCPPGNFECPDGFGCCPDGEECLPDNLCSDECPPDAPLCDEGGCCPEGTCGKQDGKPVCIVD